MTGRSGIVYSCIDFFPLALLTCISAVFFSHHLLVARLGKSFLCVFLFLHSPRRDGCDGGPSIWGFCAETNSPFCDGFILFYSVLLSPFDTRHARSRTTSPLRLCSLRFHTSHLPPQKRVQAFPTVAPRRRGRANMAMVAVSRLYPRGRAFGPPSLASRYRFEALTTQGGNVLTQHLSSFLSFFSAICCPFGCGGVR